MSAALPEVLSWSTWSQRCRETDREDDRQLEGQTGRGIREVKRGEEQVKETNGPRDKLEKERQVRETDRWRDR